MNNQVQQDALTEFVEFVLATAQTGLTFSKDRFDIQRFLALRAAASAMCAQRSGEQFDVIENWINLDTGYATPKVDVRAVILNADSHILLVRENGDGRWSLPGGFCDVGESASESACREVFEEVGLEVKAHRLLAFFDKHKHPHPPQIPHTYKVFFHCVITGGDVKQRTDETSGAAYFSVLDLPELSLHRVVQSQILTLHHHVVAGYTHTLFD